MVDKIAEINSVISGFIWGVPAMICIIGIGLLLTINTRCIQVRKFKTAMKIIALLLLSKYVKELAFEADKNIDME